MSHREIYILNDLSELGRLTAFLEQTAADWKLGKELLFQLNLAAEEAVSNIILYGFKDKTMTEPIRLEITLRQDEVIICITDHGWEFDPLKVSPPDDLNKPVQERKVGGLGVHLMREMMDQLEYRRENDYNILTLHKKI